MIVYEIAKWVEVYETAESRRHKSLTWVSMPISFTSSGYQSLLDSFGDEAAAMYGTWCVLVAFAAQCPTRGRLGNTQGTPVSLSAIARVTGFPEKSFKRLIEWASRPDVRWLISVSGELETTYEPAQATPGDCPGDAQANAGLQDKTQQDLTQQDKTDTSISIDGESQNDFDSELLSWIVWWNSLHSRQLVHASVHEKSLSKGITRGWSRFQKDKQLREVLRDRDAVAAEIEACDFCRGAWFRLEKLFGGTNRDGELVAMKLMEGGYRSRQKQDRFAASRIDTPF